MQTSISEWLGLSNLEVRGLEAGTDFNRPFPPVRLLRNCSFIMSELFIKQYQARGRGTENQSIYCHISVWEVPTGNPFSGRVASLGRKLSPGLWGEVDMLSRST